MKVATEFETFWLVVDWYIGGKMPENWTVFDEGLIINCNVFLNIYVWSQLCNYVSVLCPLIKRGIIFSLVVHYLNKIYTISATEPLPELWICFSAYNNIKKLVTSSKKPYHLMYLNGIKAISMFWVHIAHSYLTSMYGPTNNEMDILRVSYEN